MVNISFVRIIFGFYIRGIIILFFRIRSRFLGESFIYVNLFEVIRFFFNMRVLVDESRKFFSIDNYFNIRNVRYRLRRGIIYKGDTLIVLYGGRYSE